MCMQPAPEPLKSILTRLTDREDEVAMFLACGETNREIAKAMGISIKTVDTHRGHLLKKLECKNNVELCRLMIREGRVRA